MNNSLKVCMLASGSKGNCTYITDGNTALLIDLGLSCRALYNVADKANINLNNVSAIINTHNHSDHCKGIKTYIKKNKIPVYSHNKGIKYLAKYAGIEEQNICGFENSFFIGSLNITPFLLPHDAPVCCGFSIDNGKCKISIATDLGKAENKTLDFFNDSNLCIIESNHDINMLKNGNYPLCLKQRIMSKYGHLSNDDAAVAIEKITNKGCKNFLLAHLSEQNNLPEIAFTSVTNHLKSKGKTEGKDYNLSIATQTKPTKIFCYK